jgi:hypothetical protein
MEYLSSTKLKDRCSYELDYHFDSEIIDPKWDTVDQLGKFIFLLSPQEIQNLIDTSTTNATRLGTYGLVDYGTNDVDFTKTCASVDPSLVVFNANYTTPPIIQKITNLFEMEAPVEGRVNVQLPGQVWNLHIDKLQKWSKGDPKKVKRIIVHLTPWEPGHFWHYGNYTHSHWQVGDVHTFDWMQVPHSTANAGLFPRLNLQITGLATENTERFLKTLKANSPYIV